MELPVNQEPSIKKPKGKLELLNDVKKLFEKNNIDVTDEDLLSLYEKMFKKEDIKTIPKEELHKLDVKKLESSIDKQVIKVFPKKKVFVEKYGDYIEFTDELFDQMILNFQNPKLFKPYIDKDHKLEESYGEIIHLFKQDDGLYAEIQLNEIGVDAVKKRKFSYISPEWGSRINTDKEMCKNVLWAVTLTNIPALEGELPTLQEQLKLTKKGEKMDLDKKIIELSATHKTIKLQNEIDPMALVSLVDELFAAIDEMKVKYDELKGEKEAVEEIAEEAQASLAKIKEEKEAQEKEAFFDKAVEEGRVEPKELQTWKDHYDNAPEFVTKYLSSRDVKKLDKQISSHVKNEKQNDLTDLDYEIMESFKMDRNNPEDVKKYKESQGMEA